MNQYFNKKYFLPLLVFILLSVGTGAAFWLTQSSQDIRQQASIEQWAYDKEEEKTNCPEGFYHDGSRCKRKLDDRKKCAGANCEAEEDDLDPDGERESVDEDSEEKGKGIIATSFSGNRPKSEGGCGGVWMNSFCYMPGDELAGGKVVVDSGRYDYPYFENQQVADSVNFNAERVKSGNLGSTKSLGQECGGKGVAIGKICYAYGSTVNGHLVMPPRASGCSDATAENPCYAHLEKIETQYKDWEKAVAEYENSGDLAKLEKLYKDTYGIDFAVGGLYNPDAANAEMLKAEVLLSALTDAQVIKKEAAADNKALKKTLNSEELTPAEKEAIQAKIDFNQGLIEDKDLATRYQTLDQVQASISQDKALSGAFTQADINDLVNVSDAQLNEAIKQKFEKIYGYDPQKKYSGINAILSALKLDPNLLNSERKRVAQEQAQLEQDQAQAGQQNEADEGRKVDGGRATKIDTALNLYASGDISRTQLLAEVGGDTANLGQYLGGMSEDQFLTAIYKEFGVEETQAKESAVQVSNLHQINTSLKNQSATSLKESLEREYVAGKSLVEITSGGLPGVRELMQVKLGKDAGDQIYQEKFLPAYVDESIASYWQNPNDLEKICYEVLAQGCNFQLSQDAPSQLGEINAADTNAAKLEKLFEGVYGKNSGVNVEQKAAQTALNLFEAGRGYRAEKSKEAIALGALSGKTAAETILDSSSESNSNSESLSSSLNFKISIDSDLDKKYESSKQDLTSAAALANNFNSQNNFTYTANARANGADIEDTTLMTAATTAILRDSLIGGVYKNNVFTGGNNLGLDNRDARSLFYNQVGTQVFGVENIAENVATNYATARQQGYTGPANTNVADLIMQGVGNLGENYTDYSGALGFDYQAAENGFYQKLGLINTKASLAGAAASLANRDIEAGEQKKDEVLANTIERNAQKLAADYDIKPEDFVTFQTDEEVVRSRTELNWERAEKIIARPAAVMAAPLALASGAGLMAGIAYTTSAFSAYQAAGQRARAYELERTYISSDQRLNDKNVAAQNLMAAADQSGEQLSYQEAVAEIDNQAHSLKYQSNMNLANAALQLMGGASGSFSSAGNVGVAQRLGTASRYGGMGMAGLTGTTAAAEIRNTNYQLAEIEQKLNSNTLTDAQRDYYSQQRDQLKKQRSYSYATIGTSVLNIGTSAFNGAKQSALSRNSASLTTAKKFSLADVGFDSIGFLAGGSMDVYNISQSCQGNTADEQACSDAWIGLALGVAQDTVALGQSYSEHRGYQLKGADYTQKLNLVDQDIAKQVGVIRDNSNDAETVAAAKKSLTILLPHRQELAEQTLAVGGRVGNLAAVLRGIETTEPTNSNPTTKLGDLALGLSKNPSSTSTSDDPLPLSPTAKLTAGADRIEEVIRAASAEKNELNLNEAQRQTLEQLATDLKQLPTLEGDIQRLEDEILVIKLSGKEHKNQSTELADKVAKLELAQERIKKAATGLTEDDGGPSVAGAVKLSAEQVDFLKTIGGSSKSDGLDLGELAVVAGGIKAVDPVMDEVLKIASSVGGAGEAGGASKTGGAGVDETSQPKLAQGDGGNNDGSTEKLAEDKKSLLALEAEIEETRAAIEKAEDNRKTAAQPEGVVEKIKALFGNEKAGDARLERLDGSIETLRQSLETMEESRENLAQTITAQEAQLSKQTKLADADNNPDAPSWFTQSFNKAKDFFGQSAERKAARAQQKEAADFKKFATTLSAEIDKLYEQKSTEIKKKRQQLAELKSGQDAESSENQVKIDQLETEIGELQQQLRNSLLGEDSVIKVDQSGKNTRYIINDENKRPGLNQEQLEIVNEVIANFENYQRTETGNDNWKIYSNIDESKNQDIIFLSEIAALGDGRRGVFHQATTGIGKTDVVIALNAMLKQRLTGNSQFLAYSELKLMKPWTTGDAELTLNDKFIANVERQFGTGSVYIIKSNDSADIDLTALNKAKFVIATKEVAFTLQRTETEAGKAVRQKWRNSDIHGDEADDTFDPNTKYRDSGVNVAVKSKEEYDPYLAAQQKLIGRGENGESIVSRDGQVVGSPALLKLLESLEENRSIPEGVGRTNDGESGKFTDDQVEKTVLLEWLDTWHGRQRLNISDETDLLAVRKAIDDYLTNNQDTQTHALRFERAYMNDLVNFMSRIPGEDYGLATNQRQVEGQIKDVNSIAPYTDGKKIGRSYSSVVEQLIYNSLGAKVLEVNDVDSNNTRVKIANLTVGEGGSEIDFARLMMEGKSFSLYSATPEITARLYEMAFGVKLKSYSDSAADAVLARMKNPPEGTDSKVFAGKDGLAAQISDRLTEDRNQVFINMAKGLQSNQDMRNMVLEEFAQQIRLNEANINEANINEAPVSKKVFVIGANGELNEHVFTVDGKKWSLSPAKAMADTAELNKATTQLDDSNERYIKFYEFGAHVGVDTANNVDLSRAVGLCSGCNETTFGQGIGRVRLKVEIDYGNNSAKVKSAPIDVVWLDAPDSKVTKAKSSLDDFAQAIRTEQERTEALAEVKFKETLLRNSVEITFEKLITLAQDGKEGFLGIGGYKANPELVQKLKDSQEQWRQTSKMNYLSAGDEIDAQAKLTKTAQQVRSAYASLEKLLDGTGAPQKLLASQADGAIGKDSQLAKIGFTGTDDYQPLSRDPSYREIVELINSSSKHLNEVDIAFADRTSSERVIERQMDSVRNQGGESDDDSNRQENVQARTQAETAVQDAEQNLTSQAQKAVSNSTYMTNVFTLPRVIRYFASRDGISALRSAGVNYYQASSTERNRQQKLLEDNNNQIASLQEDLAADADGELTGDDVEEINKEIARLEEEIKDQVPWRMRVGADIRNRLADLSRNNADEKEVAAGEEEKNSRGGMAIAAAKNWGVGLLNKIPFFNIETEEAVDNINNIEWARVGYGDYSYNWIINPNYFDKLSKEELDQLDLESFLTDSIKKLLESVSDKPVIVMDFGATQGHTLVRLARDFSNEIENNRLILIASNLTHLPDEKLESEFMDGYYGSSISNINNEAVPDYYEHAKKVVFVNGKAADLENMTIEDVSGRPISLKGNVDIINESFVLQHIRKDEEVGATPEEREKKAVSSLENMLKKDGLIISHDLNPDLESDSKYKKYLAQKIIVNGSGDDLIKDFLLDNTHDKLLVEKKADQNSTPEQEKTQPATEEKNSRGGMAIVAAKNWGVGWLNKIPFFNIETEEMETRRAEIIAQLKLDNNAELLERFKKIQSLQGMKDFVEEREAAYSLLENQLKGGGAKGVPITNEEDYQRQKTWQEQKLGTAKLVDYPDALTPTVEEYSRHHTYLHRVFGESINNKTADGKYKKVTFIYEDLVYTYQFDPKHTSFSQGIKILEGNPNVGSNSNKELFNIIVNEEFSLDLAMSESGYARQGEEKALADSNEESENSQLSHPNSPVIAKDDSLLAQSPLTSSSEGLGEQLKLSIYPGGKMILGSKNSENSFFIKDKIERTVGDNQISGVLIKYGEQYNLSTLPANRVMKVDLIKSQGFKVDGTYYLYKDELNNIYLYTQFSALPTTLYKPSGEIINLAEQRVKEAFANAGVAKNEGNKYADKKPSERQQDAAIVYKNPHLDKLHLGKLLLVEIDGMGGYEGGAAVAQFIKKLVGEIYFNERPEVDIAERLKTTLVQVRKELGNQEFSKDKKDNPGVVLDLNVVVDTDEGEKLVTAHIGDTQTKLVTTDEKNQPTAKQLTTDQTELQRYIDEHSFSREEALKKLATKRKNEATVWNAIQQNISFDPDTIEIIVTDLKPGDRVVAFSDGIADPFTDNKKDLDEELARMKPSWLSQKLPFLSANKNYAKKLVQKALELARSNDPNENSIDNISVVTYQVSERENLTLPEVEKLEEVSPAENAASIVPTNKNQPSQSSLPSFFTALRQANFGFYDPRNWVEVFQFVKQELSSSDTRDKFLAQMKKDLIKPIKSVLRGEDQKGQIAVGGVQPAGKQSRRDYVLSKDYVNHIRGQVVLFNQGQNTTLKSELFQDALLNGVALEKFGATQIKAGDYLTVKDKQTGILRTFVLTQTEDNENGFFLEDIHDKDNISSQEKLQITDGEDSYEIIDANAIYGRLGGLIGIINVSESHDFIFVNGKSIMRESKAKPFLKYKLRPGDTVEIRDVNGNPETNFIVMVDKDTGRLTLKVTQKHYDEVESVKPDDSEVTAIVNEMWPDVRQQKIEDFVVEIETQERAGGNRNGIITYKALPVMGENLPDQNNKLPINPIFDQLRSVIKVSWQARAGIASLLENITHLTDLPFRGEFDDSAVELWVELTELGLDMEKVTDLDTLVTALADEEKFVAGLSHLSLEDQGKAIQRIESLNESIPTKIANYQEKLSLEKAEAKAKQAKALTALNDQLAKIVQQLAGYNSEFNAARFDTNHEGEDAVVRAAIERVVTDDTLEFLGLTIEGVVDQTKQKINNVLVAKNNRENMLAEQAAFLQHKRSEIQKAVLDYSFENWQEFDTNQLFAAGNDFVLTVANQKVLQKIIKEKVKKIAQIDGSTEYVDGLVSEISERFAVEFANYIRLELDKEKHFKLQAIAEKIVDSDRYLYDTNINPAQILDGNSLESWGYAKGKNYDNGTEKFNVGRRTVDYFAKLLNFDSYLVAEQVQEQMKNPDNQLDVIEVVDLGGGVYAALNGTHRVMAAKLAGVDEIRVIVRKSSLSGREIVDDKLTADEKRVLQNARAHVRPLLLAKAEKKKQKFEFELDQKGLLAEKLNEISADIKDQSSPLAMIDELYLWKVFTQIEDLMDSNLADQTEKIEEVVRLLRSLDVMIEPLSTQEIQSTVDYYDFDYQHYMSNKDDTIKNIKSQLEEKLSAQGYNPDLYLQKLADEFTNGEVSRLIKTMMIGSSTASQIEGLAEYPAKYVLSSEGTNFQGGDINDLYQKLRQSIESNFNNKDSGPQRLVETLTDWLINNGFKHEAVEYYLLSNNGDNMYRSMLFGEDLVQDSEQGIEYMDNYVIYYIRTLQDQVVTDLEEIARAKEGGADRVATYAQHGTTLKELILEEVSDLSRELQALSEELEESKTEAEAAAIEQAALDEKPQEPTTAQPQVLGERAADDTCSSCSQVKEDTAAGANQADKLWQESQAKTQAYHQAKAARLASLDGKNIFQRIFFTEQWLASAEEKLAKREADTLLKQALAQIDETRFQVANTHGMQNRCAQFYINTQLNVKEAEIRGTPAYINRAIASAYQATQIARQLLKDGQMTLIKRPSFSSAISSIFSRNQQSAPQESKPVVLEEQDKDDIRLMLDNNDPKQPGLKQMAEFNEDENGNPQPKITDGILYKLQNKAQQPSRFKNYWQQRAIQWQEIKMKWSWVGGRRS